MKHAAVVGLVALVMTLGLAQPAAAYIALEKELQPLDDPAVSEPAPEPEPDPTPGPATGVADSVFFVHGTSNQDYSGADAYWDNSELGFRDGKPYRRAYYQGTSYAAFDYRSWGTILCQLYNWQRVYGYDTTTVVTHSNGSNPVRYMLMHPTASTYCSSEGRYVQVQEAFNNVNQVVWLAGDNKGTQLADEVTTSGTTVNILHSIAEAFGLANYNTPAVVQQRRDNMATYNSNGTFNNHLTYGVCGSGTSCNGYPSARSQGSSVNANVFKSKARCGGYLSTVALWALHKWIFNGSNSDGFLPLDAQTYNGRYLFNGGEFLNHNQSRRDCNGLTDVVQEIVSNEPISYAPPAGYNVSPYDTACVAIRETQTVATFCYDEKWWGGCNEYKPYRERSHERYLGCPSSWLSNGRRDPGCYMGYGNDSWLDIPNDYSYTAYAGYSWAGQSNPYYYCPDSWRGDGTCDACIVAKYGVDAMPGTTNVHDCVPRTDYNWCSDIVWDNYDGRYEYDKQIQMLH